MWGIRIIYREWNAPTIRCDNGVVSELERIVAICGKGGSVTRARLVVACAFRLAGAVKTG